MEKSPIVTIVIVSYNTKELLLSCISSIKKWVRVRYEIIVVDNGSKDGSREAIERIKPEKIILISNKNNVGFAKANNQAFKKAKGKYILLLNSDTYLTEDCIGPSLNKLESNPKIGVLSCRLQNSDGSLQPTGGYFPTPFRLFYWMSMFQNIFIFNLFSKPFHPSPGFYKKNIELDWVTGAFFIFPRHLIETVGVLDEDYFMYVEELDFCYRVKKQNYKVLYFHDASIVHLGRGSGSSVFAIKSELKNIILFYKKHFIAWVNYATIVIKMGIVVRIILFAILGKSKQQNNYAEAYKFI